MSGSVVSDTIHSAYTSQLQMLENCDKKPEEEAFHFFIMAQQNRHAAEKEECYFGNNKSDLKMCEFYLNLSTLF